MAYRVATQANGKRLRGMPRHERLHTVVAQEIGIAIVTGRYEIGQVLPGEMAASEDMRVSRTAYREAIRMLAAKGLVETQPKAGTQVSARERWNLLDPDVLGWMLENSPDQRFLDDLLALRMIIEPAAAAAAAQRRTDDDLRAMAVALDEMGSGEPDSPASQAADERFHRAVFAAAGSEILIKLTSVVAASVKFIAEYKRERHVLRDSKPDHDALFRAIVARKPSDARKIMLRLISHAREDVSEAG